MAFEDVDHLEALVDVAEEEDVALKGKASEIEAQFWARPAHRRLEARELVTLSPQPLHK